MEYFGTALEYLGTARNVRELLKLLEKVSKSATIELQGTDDSWDYIEVWYDPAIDSVIFK